MMSTRPAWAKKSLNLLCHNRLRVNTNFHRVCLSNHFTNPTMECLHGKPASCSTTQNGTFWFCGQNPSCELFCPDQDCQKYTKVTAAFHESGCLHPVYPAHQRYAKLCIVKDKMKQSYGRTFFVCSEQEKILLNFGNGVIYLKVQDLCAYTVWCVLNEKSRMMVRIRIVYFVAVQKSTLVISSPGSNKSLMW